MIADIALLLLAYLSGSIAGAIVVCRIMGLEDPRHAGSGNPGATNVLRLHGKVAGALALSADLLKGVIPVLLARLVDATDMIIALAGLAAFLGHLFPLYFRFQGGKGVATLLGVLIGFTWVIGLLFVVSWLFAAVLFRYSSLAGIISALLMPVSSWWLLPRPAYAICLAVMALLLIWRHRANIARLMAGTEPKISWRK